MQRASWAAWLEFNAWVDEVTEGEPFDISHGGDAVDGLHHHATTEMSDNVDDQEQGAVAVLKPLFDRAWRRFFVRGTEAHVGAAAQSDNRIARALGCEPNADGHYARYDLWYRLGEENGPLVHQLHHVGTVGSQAYESTALMREYAEACIEASKMGLSAPDCIVRHHRHRYLELKVPTVRGQALVMAVHGWQMKSSAFVWRAAGVRQSVPQVGGVLLRWNKDAGLYTRSFTRFMSRSEEA